MAEILLSHPEYEGYIKYLCYLYDPGNSEVRQATSPAVRRSLASTFAGITPPEPPAPGEPESADFLIFGDISSRVFRIINNFDWELLKSREVVLERMMHILRSAEEGADSTKQITVWSTADKAIQETLQRYNDLLVKMASDDERVVEALKASRGTKPREPMSPEKMINKK